MQTTCYFTVTQYKYALSINPCIVTDGFTQVSHILCTITLSQSNAWYCWHRCKSDEWSYREITSFRVFYHLFMAAILKISYPDFPFNRLSTMSYCNIL